MEQSTCHGIVKKKWCKIKKKTSQIFITSPLTYMSTLICIFNYNTPVTTSLLSSSTLYVRINHCGAQTVNTKDNKATNELFSNLLFGSRYHCVHLVALSACSLLLHTSGGGPLATEDGTSPPDCCIFKVSSVEVLVTQVLDGFDSATRVTSQSHLGVHLSRLVSIWKITYAIRVIYTIMRPFIFFFESQAIF